MSRIHPAIPVDRTPAGALFRDAPEDDEEDEDKKKTTRKRMKKEKGIRNEERPSPKSIYPARLRQISVWADGTRLLSPVAAENATSYSLRT